MYYFHLQHSKPDIFKRLTGVSKETFALMIEVLQKGLPTRGRDAKLGLEDRLLMVLMYWREYRTFAHIAMTYCVSEATVCRTLQKFEAILIKDPRFHLPGKKVLRQAETVFEVVLIDATECPCERPKKDSEATTRARRNATPKKPRSLPRSAPVCPGERLLLWQEERLCPLQAEPHFVVGGSGVSGR